MRLCSPEQPYPGLRPFEPQEAEYFCGRKQEIRRLQGMIQEQRFVAVLGSSGAGKSSLVLAGVLPRLDEERLSTGEPAWQVLRMRPGGAPFGALAEKAAQLVCRLHPEQAVNGTVLRDRALGLLRRGSQGLQQVAVELGLTSGVRLLLIVDQFEELFRYKGIDQRQARREDEETRDRTDEAAAFAAAILAGREGDTPPVHVVITMRSDFVGEAARFLGLPEAIDAGQFLVPRMSRAQMEAAVREPLKLAGVIISPAFVQRLLNDTGTEPDALPVMQHALLRTWEEARAEATAPAPGQDHGETPAPNTSGRKLLPRHYGAVGTMAHALSQHANAILDKLSEENRELPEVARWLFRALAEVGKEGRAVRRPQRYAELVALMGGRRRKQVRRVLDRFRDDDCHFLTPFISAVPRLKADTVIDVTHEALLRNWDKLRNAVGKIGWLAEEFEDGLIWRSLVVEAETFVKDPRCTLGAVSAKKQEEWLAGLPSPYWVRRHAYPAIDTAAGPKEWHQVSRLITASSRAADRQERWRQIKLVSAVFLAFVMLVGLLFVWDQKLRKHDEYYITFVKRFGKPEGIGALSRVQASHRAVSFKFIRTGSNPVEIVQAVDSRDKCSPRHGRGTYFKPITDQASPYGECQWEFVYDREGQIVHEKTYNAFNQLIWGFVYSVSENNQTRRAFFVGPDGFPQPKTHSTAEFVEISYSSKGDEALLHYFDRAGKPQPGPDRAFGKRQEFENGLIRQRTSLDRYDRPMNDADGNATSRMIYDDRGNQIEWAAFDTEGQPTSHKDGYHKSTARYDDRGNRIEGAAFDTEGQPTSHKDGFHKLTTQYDDRGNRIEGAFFDTEGRPTSHKDGYHKSTARYDDRGTQIEWAAFDTEGQPTSHKDGFHKLTTQYDDRGNRIESAFFDTEGRPTSHKDGYHKSTARYDDRGTQIEWAAFDTEGQPTSHKDGYHKSTARYDDRGNQIESAFFDTEGRPTSHKDGYHKLTARYDDRGNQIEWAAFDTEGQPTSHKDGYHKSTARYDDRGTQIEWAAFDTEGQPTSHKDGFHKLTTQYDDRGNRIESAFFDTEGRPTSHKDGYHKSTARYDDRGTQIEGAFFDTEGRPTSHKDGYHKSTARYDDRGNRIESAFFDTEGRPTSHKDGYHKSTARYDDRGNQIESAAFDTEGRPTSHKDGYHKSTARYDDRGTQIEWAAFDTEGRPTLYKDKFHKFTTQYDVRGTPIKRAFFDTEGRPIP